MITSCRQMVFWGYWFPAVAYAVAIFVQSSFPVTDALPVFDFSDKLFHCLGYGLMGMLLFRAFFKSTPHWSLKKRWMVSAALAALYGASDEIHQSFVPSRSADWMDFAADAMGGALGATACFLIVRGWGRARNGRNGGTAQV